MPNDCYNIIECKHDDPSIIERLKEAIQREPPMFFAEFIPCPKHKTLNELWGTKWDVYDIEIESEIGNTLRLSFNTAWTPPLKAYVHLKKLGFTIDAKFMESGCDFCGYWKDGKETIFENVYENMKDVPEEFHFYFEEGDEDSDEEEAS